jgi:2-C-methyl-D-erythritol 4-phosphate cytidylyltransferase
VAKIAAIIAAGGKGERFGGDAKKTYARLDGRPVFLRTLEHFINRDDVCQTILVVPPEDLDEVKQKFGPNLGFMGVKLVAGGAERCHSVAQGIAAVDEAAELIAVHDAVRPCVTEDMIDAVFAAAAKHGAAILASPLHGTIKRKAGDGSIADTVPREHLYEAQTPQVFKADRLRAAYADLPEDTARIDRRRPIARTTGPAGVHRRVRRDQPENHHQSRPDPGQRDHQVATGQESRQARSI